MERTLREAAEELKVRLDRHSERRLPILGLRGAAIALLLREAALRLERPILAVTSLAKEADALATELAFFLDESLDHDGASRRVHLHRAWELKPFAHLSPPADVQAAGLEALFALLRQPAPVVVASVESLMMRTLPRALFEGSVVRIARGERLDRDVLIDALGSMGYQRVPHTEEPGDFSVRGGIFDVFSPLYREPLRIELEDDVVTSVRQFEASTQRSAGEIAEATIIRTRLVSPADLRDKRVHDAVAIRCAEIGMVRKEAAELAESLATGLLFPGAELLLPYAYNSALGSAFDYVPKHAVLWIVDPGRIAAEALRFAETIAQAADVAQQKPSFYPPPPSLYLAPDELERALAPFLAVEVGSLITAMAPREGWAPPIEIHSQPAPKLGSTDLAGPRTPLSFEPLAAQLNEVQRSQGRALLVVEGANQVARLRRHLEAFDIEVNASCPGFTAMLDWPDHRPVILEGEISAGAMLPQDGLFVWSEEDLFGEPRARRRLKPRPRGVMVALEELRPDDFIVHIDHGIGRYRGLKHLKVADVAGDFLNLEYAGADTMYLPVERINLVQRYVGGGDGGEPKLDKLGSGSWDRVKRRTRKAVMLMAAELLEIYAAREVMEGHAFAHPGAAYEEFAARFEFEETPDQGAAIDEVLRDMSRVKPMDRLICGDAGFGKTEVALRAAFVAVMDGRQVALLVPTTVLAEQHWNTFSARFKDYPVRVEMVSRFRSAKENRAIMEDLGRG
ncbi:MAG: CarD family transcriptional regulator, partial [Candidatus Binataceae bacterium]